MQIRNKHLWTLAGGFALAMTAGQAQQVQAETIYEELFTASADVDNLLDGETPDTGVGTWNASDVGAMAIRRPRHAHTSFTLTHTHTQQRHRDA